MALGTAVRTVACLGSMPHGQHTEQFLAENQKGLGSALFLALRFDSHCGKAWRLHGCWASAKLRGYSPAQLMG